MFIHSYFAWFGTNKREEFFECLESDVFDKSVIAAIDSFLCCTALANYCEVVMHRKERAERERRALGKQWAISASVSLGSDFGS